MKVEQLKLYSGVVLEDVEVELKDSAIGASSGGVIDFRGTMRVKLHHLTSEFIPLFHAVTIYLTKKPSIVIDFTDFLNAFEAAEVISLGIVDIATKALNVNPRDMIDEVVASKFVYPNRMIFSMNPQAVITNYQFPPPMGLLRVHVASLKKLSDSLDLFGSKISGLTDYVGLIYATPSSASFAEI